MTVSARRCVYAVSLGGAVWSGPVSMAALGGLVISSLACDKDHRSPSMAAAPAPVPLAEALTTPGPPVAWAGPWALSRREALVEILTAPEFLPWGMGRFASVRLDDDAPLSEVDNSDHAEQPKDSLDEGWIRMRLEAALDQRRLLAHFDDPPRASAEEEARALAEDMRGFHGDTRWLKRLGRLGLHHDDWVRVLARDIMIERLLRERLANEDPLAAPAEAPSNGLRDAHSASPPSDNTETHRLPNDAPPASTGNVPSTPLPTVKVVRVRLRHILVSEEAQAERLANDLRRGRLDFADAAERFSLAPEAHAGGELPPFGPGEYPPVFEVAFTVPVVLSGPESVVGPLQSPYGWHLLRVEERIEGGEQPPRASTSFHANRKIAYERLIHRLRVRYPSAFDFRPLRAVIWPYRPNTQPPSDRSSPAGVP